jgi:hypothetical protein
MNWIRDFSKKASILLITTDADRRNAKHSDCGTRLVQIEIVTTARQRSGAGISVSLRFDGPTRRPPRWCRRLVYDSQRHRARKHPQRETYLAEPVAAGARLGALSAVLYAVCVSALKPGYRTGDRQDFRIPYILCIPSRRLSGTLKPEEPILHCLPASARTRRR